MSKWFNGGSEFDEEIRSHFRGFMYIILDSEEELHKVWLSTLKVPWTRKVSASLNQLVFHQSMSAMTMFDPLRLCIGNSGLRADRRPIHSECVPRNSQSIRIRCSCSLRGPRLYLKENG